MAEVVRAQSPEMEDYSMADATMISNDDSHLTAGDGFWDPMDISNTPPTNQPEMSSQPTAVFNNQNSLDPQRPPSPLYKIPFGSRRFTAPSCARLVDGKPVEPQINSTSFRPRFSPKSKLRVPYHAYAGPSKACVPMTNRARSSTFTANNTNFVGFHHNNRSRFFPDNQTVSSSLLTARAALLGNGSKTGKLLEGTGRPKATSFFSGSTVQSSLPRKRSFDEGTANDETNHTTPESDTLIRSKYRRASQEGLVNLLQGDSETSHSNVGGQASSDQPIAAPTTFPAQSASSYPQPSQSSLSHFGNYLPTETPSRAHELRGAARGQTQRTPGVNIPGSWPQTPGVFSTPNREGVSTTGTDVANDYTSFTSGVATSNRVSTGPLVSTSVDIPQGHALDTENPQMQAIEGIQNAPPNGSSWQANWLYWVETVQRIYNGPHGMRQTVASVVRSAVEVAGSVKRRALGLFERRRPISPPRRPISVVRASPTRANIRALPEEQRQRLKSRQWDRERGRSPVESYPFPELSLDIPQFPAGPSSAAEAHVAPIRPVPQKPTSNKNAHKAAGRLRPSAPRNASSAKERRHKKNKSASHERSLAQQPSPSLQRRMLLKPTSTVPERVRRIRSILQARRSEKLAIDKIQSKAHQVPKPDYLVPKSLKTAEPEHRAVPKPSILTEEQRAAETVHETEPVHVPELVTELAPHLHPSSPVSPKDGTGQQKENVPPKIDVEVEPIVDPWFQPVPEYPLGRPVSAVRLFYPDKKPLPAGRTESIYASKWREIEEGQKRDLLPTRIRPEGPAVRPLTAKWDTRISEAMTLPNSRTVATTLSGDPLTKRDLSTCYTRMDWLNDEVINAYLALIVDYLRRSHGNTGRRDKPRFHAFNSFFFSNLRDKGYSSVRRWASRAKIGGEDLLNVDTVFIPIHNSSHWTLVVVKPSERTIENFDSLGTLSSRHVALVKDWLRGELGSKYVEEEWTVLPSVSPQQNNGSDCGVFLLSTAKAVAIGIEPLSYGAKDIPLLRRKIVGEIMNGGLEGDFSPSGEDEEVLL
ncbi:hypothetical protein ASPWEDRAFT_170917 [Aspergillus wentii DTO 134E9]|uniref:Ubiquitin-like protease family profile domain-containing protein n=1 Tax=Aspergillus wentii DTO 134E9 TaxID=1073089 RepID=A0A1L9RR86_ASPWE|nr:uncharacterized protein ASPWEDRAFT_170917 [Aspergillus wentii DTO 134E9]KAI9930291.1 hypothetical protein MW887_011042 [Aspergillus wentii]OJJ37439.1 hypothetical protein ASPWEDRAFT_170917 [Aspergillus wentii DTO 134E9]